ncbi:MAG: aminopeptidase P family N-terminal domain-containing protein, partial [Ruthenibacterium sp.]
MMKERMKNLVTAMPAGFDAALITTPVNRFYFLGLDTGDAGTLLVLPEKAYFIIDSRYIEIARREVTTAEVILEDKALVQLAELVYSHGVRRVDMENKETVA